MGLAAWPGDRPVRETHGHAPLPRCLFPCTPRISFFYSRMERVFRPGGLTWLMVTAGLLLPAVVGAEPTPLPVAIAPTAPNLRYVGRFDLRDAAGPRCSWPACTVSIRFQGSALNAKIRDDGHNFWQTVVDGQPAAVLELGAGEQLYAVAAGLTEGEHRVDLVKATEGFVGITQFTGFQVSEGGKLLPVPAPPRRIEVIGDSISCGYGNMAGSQLASFSPQTENAYYTYGAIAARQLGADYLCVAFSGKKMWPDNTIPEMYDRTLTFDASSSWTFSAYTPDAVVINLATNDFGPGNPDMAGWTSAYEAFIQRVRQNYPKARIYCAIGTMMADWEPRKPLSTLRSYLAKVVADCAAAGDRAVQIIDFGVQNPLHGIGANWHPSKKTQELMGAQLAATLKQDFGW